MRARASEAPTASRKRREIGILYSATTALLLATQHPFSTIAARQLSTAQFIVVTQCALLASTPFMLLSSATRRDVYALVSNISNVGRLLVLFLIGIAGLICYNLGLSKAHPIIIAAILNLSPFWAALVALVVSRKAIPVSPRVFFACLFVAFLGAMFVAWSQIPSGKESSIGTLGEAFLHASWIYAVPVPIFFALSGTLIGQWFSNLEEAASVAAMFVLSAVILIPAALYISHLRSETLTDEGKLPAIALLLVGTLIAAAAGRLFYQMALTATDNDNGFVSMFLLLVPALTCLLSIPMSWWIPDLHFVAGPMFYLGLTLIAAPLLVFSLQSQRADGATGKGDSAAAMPTP